MVTDSVKADCDNIYKMKAQEQDYVNPTADGGFIWKCDSSCASDEDED
jgi:hypothetical protein